jgi:serine/threonine protein kinase
VLELCENGTLDDLIYSKDKLREFEVRSEISWQTKLELCLGVAGGMAYLHSKGIIHWGA